MFFSPRTVCPFQQSLRLHSGGYPMGHVLNASQQHFPAEILKSSLRLQKQTKPPPAGRGTIARQIWRNAK